MEKRITLEEIKPVQYSKRRTRVVKYERVSRGITKEKILALWELRNAEEIPFVIEDRRFIIFQYPEKPTILIRKKDGRLYSYTSNQKRTKHQAFLVLDLLQQCGLVSNWSRRTVAKKALKLTEEEKK